MADHPTPGGFSWDRTPGTEHTDPSGRTSVTTAGRTITWYTTTPAPAGPGARPPAPSRGRGGRVGRFVAVLAVVAALVFTGAVVARQLGAADFSTTSMPQQVAPQTGLQAPDQSAQAPSTGSGNTGTTADAAAVAAKVSPAVVNIEVKDGYTSSGGAATGIVLTSDGYVLTNNHVIKGATEIRATSVGNGQTYTADVVGYDGTHDIALIKLRDASGLTAADIGDSSALAVGDAVVGVGNAGGDGGEPTVAAGVVLGLDRQIVAGDATGDSEQLSGLIHTDADIQSGDSGGPLANADGEVIGVMTAASASGPSSAYGYGSATGDTEGFAVPIATAVDIVNQIKDGEASATVHIGETAFLGVQTTDASSQDSYGYGDGYPDPYGYGYSDPYGYGDGSGSASPNGDGSGQSGPATGATVAGVVTGSPAEAAGLTAGDVITSVGGTAVTSAEGLSTLIAQHHPGDTVTIAWTDASGGSHSADVELAKGPAK